MDSRGCNDRRKLGGIKLAVLANNRGKVKRLRHVQSVLRCMRGEIHSKIQQRLSRQSRLVFAILISANIVINRIRVNIVHMRRLRITRRTTMGEKPPNRIAVNNKKNAPPVNNSLHTIPYFVCH